MATVPLIKASIPKCCWHASFVGAVETCWSFVIVGSPPRNLSAPSWLHRPRHSLWRKWQLWCDRWQVQLTHCSNPWEAQVGAPCECVCHAGNPGRVVRHEEEPEENAVLVFWNTLACWQCQNSPRPGCTGTSPCTSIPFDGRKMHWPIQREEGEEEKSGLVPCTHALWRAKKATFCTSRKSSYVCESCVMSQVSNISVFFAFMHIPMWKSFFMALNQRFGQITFVARIVCQGPISLGVWMGDVSGAHTGWVTRLASLLGKFHLSDFPAMTFSPGGQVRGHPVWRHYCSTRGKARTMLPIGSDKSVTRGIFLARPHQPCHNSQWWTEEIRHSKNERNNARCGLRLQTSVIKTRPYLWLWVGKRSTPRCQCIKVDRMYD